MEDKPKQRCEGADPTMLAYQGLFGIGTVAVIFYGGYNYCGCIVPLPATSRAEDRFGYALRCTFPMLLLLMFAALKVMALRASSAALDPLAGNEGIVLLHKNILTNTLEQFVVSVMLMLVATSLFMSKEEMKLVALFAFSFMVGRILYRSGYCCKDNAYRGFGMAISLYSQVVLLAVICYRMAAEYISDAAVTAKAYQILEF